MTRAALAAFAALAVAAFAALAVAAFKPVAVSRHVCAVGRAIRFAGQETPEQARLNCDMKLLRTFNYGTGFEGSSE
jgi:hypothetical protein